MSVYPPRVSASLVLSAAAWLGAAPAFAAQDAEVEANAVLLRYPDVSATQIVFRYDGDLWLVPKEGGDAQRLTTVAGNESLPRFSPDGTQVAFMGGYDGGTDLYVMDLAAGAPRRVTYHPGAEYLCDWTPDGEGLLYWSSEEADLGRASRLMTVPVDGGQPEALPPAYGTFGSIDASGEWLAYTPGSREFRTWKRYQGGLAQDIWLFNLRTLDSRRLTDFVGTDSQPMWSGDRLIFSSDRGPNAILNLWSMDTQGGDARQLTNFTEFGVRFASIGPDDVVFENGGKLYRYELGEERVVPVEVRLPGERAHLRRQTMDVAPDLASASAGPTGKRVVVEARGDLFDVPVGEGVTRHLTPTSGVAERAPAWSPDGKWIAYFSDQSGEYELHLRRADGETFEGAAEDGSKQVTRMGPGWRYSISWAPDSEKLTFTANDGSLWLYDLESDNYDRVAIHPGGSPLNASWAPNSDWLAWSHRHREAQIDALFLYDLENGTTHQVTSGLFDDSNPVFSPDGKYLYFDSTRTFSPIYADLDDTWIYANTRRVLAVPLTGGTEHPYALEDPSEPNGDEEDDDAEGEDGGDGDGEDGSEETDANGAGDGASEGTDDAEASEGEAAEDGAEADDEEDEERTEIDLEGFESRAMFLPIESGQIRGLGAVDGALLYFRMPRTGVDGGSPDLMRFDLESEKEQTVLAGCNSYEILSGGKLFARAGGKWGIIDPAPGQSIDEPLDLSGLVVERDPRAEWQQMLVDAWRIFRDFFYDPGMHGVDWPGVRQRYEAALADATSRDDLHFLLGEMIAELNVGHAYNRGPARGLESGDDARPVGLLGADIEFDVEAGAYRIARILRGEAGEADARSPLSRHGVEASAGDYILEVNGRPVDGSRAFHAAMVGTAGRTTELLLSNSASGGDDERRVLVTPTGSDAGLRYRDWVRRNRERVSELSGGRVGYIHVPDTGQNGQNELMRQFLGQHHKDALLIDERWNGGGQIPTRFIELLDRFRTNFWAIRHGEDWDWPPLAHVGPKAMLINGWAGSGGDAFPHYFRQYGIGKLIGRRTWGGLVGISGNPALVDGTAQAVPRFAFYELDGTWGIEGHGVDPDIEVLDDPTALAQGGDPQLEAGVAHLLEELETFEFPNKQRPAGPDRSGAGIPTSDH
jgi:tricorn protease